MTSKRAIIAVLLAAGLLLSLAPGVVGCGKRRPNILLLTLDTTRADHLRCYGYDQIETPGLNELAREGVLFEHAYSHSPLTLPAHTSIMSGIVPMSHGVIDNGGYKVPDELATLAEVLKGQGYGTAAFISAKVLDKDFHLNQGFDVYNQEGIEAQKGKSDVYLWVDERKADKTTDAAIQWLAGQQGKPWFAWVHYYDPHIKYAPPAPYSFLYRNPYDGEIAFMDSQIKRLTGWLRGNGVWDDTIVIAVGDHGESLMEHGERTHANFIYNATAHVPLIIRIPGVKSTRVATAVSHIDILPTLLSWLKLEIPARVEGESLLPLMTGEDAGGEERYAWLESKAAFLHYGWSPLAGVVNNRYKYIKAPKPELYDLDADPGEMHNLYTPDNKIALKLRAQLDGLEKLYSRLVIKSEEAPTDARMQAQFAALGYMVQGANGSPALAAKKDPKDYADLFDVFVELIMAVNINDFPKVMEVVDRILKRDPDNPTAMDRRAWALFGLGRFDESLAAYQLFFKTHNDTYEGWLYIGHIYLRRSQDAKINYRDAEWKENLLLAREAYTKALSLKDEKEARYLLGRIEMELGNLEGARKIFEGKELAESEWGALGMAKYYQLQGRPGLAEAEFARIQDNKENPNIVYWQEYAQFLLNQNRAPEALALLDKAVKKDPSLSTDTGFLRAIATARAAAGASASPAPAPAGSGSGSALPGATAH